METYFRVTLLLAGIINLLPSILVFFPEKIPTAYGILMEDINLELLLRHRAVLFFIVGCSLIFAAWKQDYYIATSSIGLLSMLSFVGLYAWMGTDFNAALTKIMWTDVWASLLLLTGLIVYYGLKAA